MRRRHGWVAGAIVGAAVLAAAGAAGLTPARAVEATAGDTVLAVRGRASEHATLASAGNLVAAVWAAADAAGVTDIYAAVSRDGGVRFGAPVRVNRAAGQARAGTEQPPRVLVLPAAPGAVPPIVVGWLSRHERGSVLLTARSGDGGATFGAAEVLPGTSGAGNRGWHSMAADAGGRVHAVWLDHRDATGAGHHQHQTGAALEDGVARAQRSQLFVGSVDGAVAARGLARGVCYCCKTAVAAGADGTIYAAWRHVYAGNRRDIAVAASRDGGRTFDAPVRVSADDWELDGCPENGPAIGVDSRGRVHVIWPTLVRIGGGETLRLFHASSRDGRAFSPRAPLPVVGAAYHPQLSIAGETLVVAWDEVVSGMRQVRLLRGAVDGGGRVRFAAPLPIGQPTGMAPAVAVAGGHAIVAWSRQVAGERTVAVRRLPLSAF